MLAAISAFFCSCLITLLIIRYRFLHEKISGDTDFDSPQKFHTVAVPRIGGVSIMFGLLAGLLVQILGKPNFELQLILFLCVLPTFAIGLAEDLTKSASIKARFIVTAFSALLAVHFLDMPIVRVDVFGIDQALLIPGISILFTVFAITGITNAYNIIDGFHGLASMVATFALIAVGYLALSLNDRFLAQTCFLMVGATLGFFIWNYPRGLIFLGDSGAYLLGFWAAVSSILLIVRHPDISPWVAVMINGYPIIETLFSIWRKAIYRKRSPGEPDSIHFHMLIYRRVLSPNQISKKNEDYLSLNAKTSPYLWMLAGCTIVPAILWPLSTPILMVFAFLVFVFYLWVYRRIVRFQTPRWLHMF